MGSFEVQPNWFAVLRVLSSELPPEVVHGPGVRDVSLTPIQLNGLEERLSRIVIRWVVESTWRSPACLCDGQLRRGKLWQRHAHECSLRFTEQTGVLLRWLASGATTGSSSLDIRTRGSRSTVGDQLVWALALQRFGRTRDGRAMNQAIASQTDEIADWSVWARTVSGHGDFGSSELDSAAGLQSSRVEIERWTSSGNAWVLEFAAERIADEWLRFERAKWSDGRPARISEITRSQASLLAGWLEPAIESDRLDLIRPLLRVLREAALCGEARGAAAAGHLRMVADLDLQQLLHDWNAAGRLAVRLAELTEAARDVGYFDEGYHASQFWLNGTAAVDLPAIVQRFRSTESLVTEALGATVVRPEVWT